MKQKQQDDEQLFKGFNEKLADAAKEMRQMPAISTYLKDQFPQSKKPPRALKSTLGESYSKQDFQDSSLMISRVSYPL